MREIKKNENENAFPKPKPRPSFRFGTFCCGCTKFLHSLSWLTVCV